MTGRAATSLIPEPGFDDGEWHTLQSLRRYEEDLLMLRQSDSVFSDAVRVDGSRREKLRRDEWSPFLDFAKHVHLPPECCFRKVLEDRDVDVEVRTDGSPLQLQITTAYRMFFDKKGDRLNGGHQYRLEIEKLTADRHLWGTGPFDPKKDGTIKHREELETSEEIETSCRLGLIEAFRRKSASGSPNVTLIVKACGFTYATLLDSAKFQTIAEAAANSCFPSRFGRVYVVDYGPGFIWSRSSSDTG